MSMSDIRRSLFITFFSSNASTVVMFGVTLVLARLLSPAEIGIFSITVVFIGLAAVFREFGITSYLQREKDLTPAKKASALGLSIATSWTLAAVIYFASDAIAHFYEQPGIGEVTRVMALSFGLVPFASFYYALFARDLQAGKQAIVNATSTLVYAITCISLAYMGLSYMALAWANVANLAASIVTYVWLQPRKEHYFPRFSGWGEPIKFGGGAILGSLITQLNGSIPDLVLGKVSGPRDVGLFSRANGLVNIFYQIAGPTIAYNAMPYIARNHHANVPLGPMLARSSSFLTGLAWPSFIMIGFFAPEWIHVLYGEKWLPAAPLVVYLSIAALARIGYNICGPALMAIGRPYLSAISAIANLLCRFAAIFLMGANDALSFAQAICIADVVSTPILAWLQSRYLGFSIKDSLLALLPSFKIGMVCLLLAVLLKACMPTQWHDAWRLGVASACMIMTWLGAVIFFRHEIHEEFPPIIRRILPASLAAWLIELITVRKVNA